MESKTSIRILTIVGARPQFIKASAVSRQIALTEGVEEILLHTGQHYDNNMSDIFFEELEISKPDINLDIGSSSHGQQTAQMLIGIEKALIEHKPSCVLVYGDTNSTIAGTLGAAKLNIPVCHVEAGLRSFNRNMPEEINRILTDHASDRLYAPTTSAAERLEFEGIEKHKIIYSGDVMLDAAMHYKTIALKKSKLVNDLGLIDSEFVLATVHRAENTDEPKRLMRILEELEALSDEITVVLPLHPRTRSFIEQNNLDIQNIKLIDPVGFLDMVALETASIAIITDSGGVQKEAFFQRKPCITLRNETEWTELIDSGWNILYPPVHQNTESLQSVLQMMCSSEHERHDISPYGNGNASKIIVADIVKLCTL